MVSSQVWGGSIRRPEVSYSGCRQIPTHADTLHYLLWQLRHEVRLRVGDVSQKRIASLAKLHGVGRQPESGHDALTDQPRAQMQHLGDRSLRLIRFVLIDDQEACTRPS